MGDGDARFKEGSLEPLDRCHVIVALLPGIKHVSPLLHHLSAVAKVYSMTVGAPHSIQLGMGQLTFDPVGGKPQLIQPFAAGSSAGMWVVFLAPTESVEHSSQRCFLGDIAPCHPEA